MAQILYIIPYLSTGGTEKHLLDLVNGFQDEHQLFLLAPPGETANLFAQTKVKYYSFPRLDLELFPGLKAFFRNLRQILRTHDINLIHIHGAPELMLLVRMVNHRLPILFTVHGFHGEMKSWDYWFCARLCNRFARHVIAVAGAEERILIQKGLRRELVQTVLNGVPDPWQINFTEPESIKKIPEDRTIIGAIARLETTKGINFLLEAFATISKDFNKLHLVLVGSGSKEQELKDQTLHLGLTDRVTFTGYQQNTHDYLKYFQIMLIPSLHEAHPLVLMEAMGQAKPIIATTVGGIPEVIADGINGLLVPPADAPSIARALERLLKDRELQAKLGAAARQTYENKFTVSRMLNETRRIYDGILTSTSTGHRF